MNMKRIVSVLLVVALCAVCACAAFAASATPSVGTPSVGTSTGGSSSTLPAAPEVTVSTSIASVGTVKLNVSVATVDNGSIFASAFNYSGSNASTVLTAFQKKAASFGTYTTLYTFDLSVLTNSGALVEGSLGKAVTVDLTKVFPNLNFNRAGVAFKLLHYTSNGVEVLPVSSTGTVSVSSLSPFQLIAVESVSTTTTTTTTTTDSSTATSPKTGLGA